MDSRETGLLTRNPWVAVLEPEGLPGVASPAAVLLG